MDLSLYFLTAALARLKPDGHLSLLIPGKFLQAGYAASLRHYLLKHSRINFLFDFGIDHRLVFKADTFPLVVGLSKCAPQPGDEVAVELVSKGEHVSFQRRQPALADRGGNWVLGSRQVSQRGTALGDKVTIQRGVVTNAKRWFVFAEHPQGFNPAHIQPLLRGRDIQPRQVVFKHCIYWPFGNPKWRDQMTAAESRWLRGSGKLRQDRHGMKLPYAARQFPRWLLVWPYLATEFRVALVPTDQWIPDQTCYYIGFSEFKEAYRYFAFLNSVDARQQLQRIAQRGKDRFFFFYAKTCRDVLLPQDFEQQPLTFPKERRLFLPDEGRQLWQSQDLVREAS